jgi:hypothetical protein
MSATLPYGPPRSTGAVHDPPAGRNVDAMTGLSAELPAWTQSASAFPARSIATAAPTGELPAGSDRSTTCCQRPDDAGRIAAWVT